jgi:predicted nuclease of predicted toxin-antitoxin system
MLKYIIDANLPYYFSLWQNKEYIHVIDIDPHMKDSQIWQYAKENNLTIITKDADFSDRIQLQAPPPKVIHIKFGNMKMKEFHKNITSIWDNILKISQDYKLVNVYIDKIEGIG